MIPLERIFFEKTLSCASATPAIFYRPSSVKLFLISLLSVWSSDWTRSIAIKCNFKIGFDKYSYICCVIIESTRAHVCVYVCARFQWCNHWKRAHTHTCAHTHIYDDRIGETVSYQITLTPYLRYPNLEIYAQSPILSTIYKYSKIQIDR